MALNFRVALVICWLEANIFQIFLENSSKCYILLIHILDYKIYLSQSQQSSVSFLQ